MAKFLIDDNALDNLAKKIQRLEVLFDVIPEEPTGAQISVEILCGIGADISRLAAIELENMRAGTHAANVSRRMPIAEQSSRGTGGA
ncbi:hypothetical protein [Burkholderia sp. D-99]|uniref:hypothetical protein n=1 Tax=Burkholderia sp. D-99 TaxID=2717316 RepID=UPI001AA126B0|nr:hypothetical protein [Burkholderia sp. D-99]